MVPQKRRERICTGRWAASSVYQIQTLPRPLSGLGVGVDGDAHGVEGSGIGFHIFAALDVGGDIDGFAAVVEGKTMQRCRAPGAARRGSRFRRAHR